MSWAPSSTSGLGATSARFTSKRRSARISAGARPPRSISCASSTPLCSPTSMAVRGRRATAPRPDRSAWMGRRLSISARSPRRRRSVERDPARSLCWLALTRILIENAGAQRGWSCCRAARTDDRSLRHLGVFRCRVLLAAVAGLDAAVRSGGQLCGAHARARRAHPRVAARTVSQRPYITSHRVKSLLCVPVRQSGALMATVYL